MKRIMACFIGCTAVCALASNETIVSTTAYRWTGDTIIQGPFRAFAPDSETIVSDYHAQPGYHMGIEQEWRRRNDLTPYPRLTTPNRLHEAAYNMALDEMVNAVEPDTTLRTGREWAGVWTRDVSYSIILSMASLQPEASRISLMKKVDPLGRIIQDTGSGGAWPVSTDRAIWAIAAYEVYKVTGDRKWLEYIYPIIKRSLETDAHTVYDPATGLVRGETSFIDWREQSHPKWMQPADIFNTETLSTSTVHARAWQVLGEIAALTGHKKEAAEAERRANAIADAINARLWNEEKGLYDMYLYGRDHLISNPRSESLGQALAILWDIAPADRAVSVTRHAPVTPYGVPVFYPQIPDMPAYHNNALWPWVAAYWGLANAKAGNEEGVMQAIGSVMRPAALFCTNKENLNLDNGDIATELNSSNMLWCLSGNLALTHRLLFGLDFERDGLAFRPFVPEALGAQRKLTGFRYRGALLDITVSGYGGKIASFTLNGKPHAPYISAGEAKGRLDIDIVMDNRPIDHIDINMAGNRKAPLTPLAWAEDGWLQWNPIEYIDHYTVIHNGKKVADTRQTRYPMSEPGEYQVTGIDSEGIAGFASEPRYAPGTETRIPAGYGREVLSAEHRYKPTTPVEGFTGEGFVEIDTMTSPVSWEINVPEEGNYTVSLRYANGNGPVNTENACAIRSLSIDGELAGTVVMPQRGRGNWDDWGLSNPIPVSLKPGTHTVTVEYLPDNTNMNIDSNHALVDALVLRKK